ncbi:MAG: magnesium/cobalt transporter CorA [Sandaracinaceae bacterium]
MPKRIKRSKRKRPRSNKPSAPPGTLQAHEGADASTVRVLMFDETRLLELEGLSALDQIDAEQIAWVDVVGLGSVDLIRAVGDAFGLHPLALEDVLHPHQRAKVEDYDDTIFFVSRFAREEEGTLDIEQVSMFIGDGFVVTFQEREGDAYDSVRRRLRESRGRIRRSRAAYLGYALIDASVDAMFPLLEVYEDRLEALEDEVFDDPSSQVAERLHDVGRDLMRVRRAVLPMREALSRMMRREHALLDDELDPYLRDCHDHLCRMMDRVDGQRDLVTSLTDGHRAAQDQRSNDVMKVLTIMSTLFIPLSFIVGLYGMNFDAASPYNMPELHWRYGYPVLLAVMALMVGGMLFFFRRRGWL